MDNILKKAFTLIELLVVIAVIGILSGLIVVSMSGTTQKATIAKGQVFSNSLRNSLMSNLISEWKLDEIVGTSAPYTTSDSWNGGNVGTLFDGASTACSFSGTLACPQKVTSDCVYGNCLSFDGSNDNVNCGGTSSLSMSDAITMAAWIKIKDNYGSKTEAIISKPGSYLMYATAGWMDRPHFYIYCEAAENAIYGTYTLEKDKWYYLVTTYDKTSKKMTLYINGAYNNSLVLTGRTDYSITTTANAVVLNNGNQFNGLIDEVRIFSAAASAAQIKEQYCSGLNSLLINGSITQEEYLSRLNNYAQN